MTTIDSITREQVEQLMTEAGAAGDQEQVRLCELALRTFRAMEPPASGRVEIDALQKCVRAIRAAEAMAAPEELEVGDEIATLGVDADTGKARRSYQSASSACW